MAGKFGWVVDKEYDFGESKVGIDTEVMGPRNATATKEEIVAQGIHFKMYDDDGNLYYSGYVLADDDHNEFMPLDHYGAPNAGCTYMKLRNKDGTYSHL